jgi:hypothetical protein
MDWRLLKTSFTSDEPKPLYGAKHNLQRGGFWKLAEDGPEALL